MMATEDIVGDLFAAADAETAQESALTPATQAELAKLAARRGETTSSDTLPNGRPAKSRKRKGAANPEPASAPSSDDEKTDATASSSGDSDLPEVIPGLTSSPDAGGQSAYEKRKAELDAARARGRAPKKGKAKAKTEKQVAREKADKDKQAARAKADRQKEREKTRADKEKADQAKRKEKEAERKAEQAKKRAAVAAARAAKATPDLLKKEPKDVQELFAQHYKKAREDGVRREKCDRGDFAAGWMMFLREMRKQGVAAPKPAKTAEAA